MRSRRSCRRSACRRGGTDTPGCRRRSSRRWRSRNRRRPCRRPRPSRRPSCVGYAWRTWPPADGAATAEARERAGRSAALRSSRRPSGTRPTAARTDAGSANGPASSAGGGGGTSSSMRSKSAPAPPPFSIERMRVVDWPGSTRTDSGRGLASSRPGGQMEVEPDGAVQDGGRAVGHRSVWRHGSAEGLRARRREQDVHAVGLRGIVRRSERRRRLRRRAAGGPRRSRRSGRATCSRRGRCRRRGRRRRARRPDRRGRRRPPASSPPRTRCRNGTARGRPTAPPRGR